MLLKFCHWLLKDRKSNRDALDPAGKLRADAFFADLEKSAWRTDPITYAFLDIEERAIAHIQLRRAGGEVEIHRIWSTVPRQGHGSAVLKKVCELADIHGVILKLTVNPLGVAPYPLSSSQLRDWYARHGFEGGRKMTRSPRQEAIVDNRECRMTNAQ
jgi:hypothetical protein